MLGGLISGAVSMFTGGGLGGIATKVLSGIGGGLMDKIGDLIGSFGKSNVEHAAGNSFMDALGGGLEEAIKNSPLPGPIKDMAIAIVKEGIEAGKGETTPEAQEGVNDSDLGKAMDEAGMGTAKCCSEEADEASSKGGKNWLQALAEGLSKVQAKFLDDAMAAQDTMASSTGEENRSDFLTAQGDFQASMQMFSISTNAMNNSIKTIGESLAKLANKTG